MASSCRTMGRPLRLLLLLGLLGCCSASRPSAQGPSGDFSAHKIVRPRVYHGRSKREIASTRESETDHADVLSVGLQLNGVDRILKLRLNEDLIAAGYKERHQHRGSYKTHQPSKVELCHYQGSIQDVPGSWVAVSTCHGLKGVIFDGENLHYIHPEDESLQSGHYLYNHSDLIANHTCGYKGTNHHIADEFIALGKAREVTRHKRASESVRGPYNANRQSRFVELVLVIDKNEYMALGENLTRVHHHCKDIANIINALYTPLNIFIALVGVEVWTDTDEIHLLSNGDMTLNNFLAYRREKLVESIPNDNAQLLTKMQFDEGVVGKALKGPICTYEFSGGVSVDHSNVVGLVAATVAHEMGHNFGMEHDTTECACPEERCIMAPSSGSSGPVHWSSCSLEYLALAFEHGMDYCLRNKPRRLFDSPVCGNGFVEPGEQCDCGLAEECNNPCCDAATCMLHSNASCATGECCDLARCKPKRAGSLCRSAEQECDLPEYCTGQGEYCPRDVFKIDGEQCNVGKAYCYQGACRTHDDQCKLLWGPTGSSSDWLCYDMNSKGNKNGNCGYNRTGENYVKCNDPNIRCGMLHCKHLNERLEFGMESVATLSHSFINSLGKIIACRSAIVDLGLNQVDPGLAPDGAKCSAGKMCVNQKCMPVAELRMSTFGGKACPNNCSGNGVCNSLGHCHCSRGYQPPDCIEPGVGGSEDSGPAEDPNARSEYIMGLYIVFLGIVPVAALVSFGVWYARNNGGALNQWKKASSGPMSTLRSGFGYGHSQPRPPSRPLNGTKATERPGIDTIDSSLAAVQQGDPACASLLPKTDPDERFNNNFFGQFKGFSIVPLQGQPEATRVAPPPPPPQQQQSLAYDPSPVTVPIKTNPRPPARSSAPQPAATAPPALPPPNAGSTARPLISSPVLSATTCVTSLELLGKRAPGRPAPRAPDRPPDPEAARSRTLTRLASMLAPISGAIRPGHGPYNTQSLPRHHKASKLLDRQLLRSLEISAPIPQSEIEVAGAALPVSPERRPVMRAQSMRDSKPTGRPGLHSFGSMRQPAGAARRPTSIPASSRPTSPPPVPPVAAKSPEPQPQPQPQSQPQSQPQPQPQPKTTIYDDCMNLVGAADKGLADINEESPGSDNIYAVIEEPVPEKAPPRPSQPSQPSEYKTPTAVPVPVAPAATLAAAPGADSLGLLGEIVSEISNRNLESIYSTKQLSPEHKPASSSSTYANYKSAGSVYSNSSTGSGYVLPSAINAPEPKQPARPSYSPAGKEQPKPGPGRARTPGHKPTRLAPDRAAKDNSPDLVSSCHKPPNDKSPDVLGKPAKQQQQQQQQQPPAKKALVAPPKPAVLLAKPAVKGLGHKPASAGAGKTSVASLQQKFERPEKNEQTAALGRKKNPATANK